MIWFKMHFFEFIYQPGSWICWRERTRDGKKREKKPSNKTELIVEEGSQWWLMQVYMGMCLFICVCYCFELYLKWATSWINRMRKGVGRRPHTFLLRGTKCIFNNFFSYSNSFFFLRIQRVDPKLGKFFLIIIKA